jgi:histidinol-phosphatase (PHP family)
MLDYHIHSNFSFDSKAKPREICQAALDLGLREIAITDHYSFAPYSPNHRFFRPEDYFRTWTDLQKEYQGRLTIRIGLELDEFANFPAESNHMVRSFPWDFVIGSTHDLEGGTLRTYLRKYKDPHQATAAYYKALILAVQLGNFHVLAHFDLIKRYIADEGYTPVNHSDYLPQIDEIFSMIIARSIALEVNTSGLFQACGETFPSTALLKRYYKAGGRLITLGSDAHSPDKLSQGFGPVIGQLKDMGFPGLVSFSQGKKEILTW